MTLNAQTVLAQHVKTWDMPTLNQQHPEMVRWIADRWEVHFGIVSEVIVIDKRTDKIVRFTTGDTRIALKELLEAEVTTTAVHKAVPGTSNPPGHCGVCKAKLTRVAEPYKGSDHLWVHADTGLEMAPNPKEEAS